MLTQEEIAAIKLIVGPVVVEEVQSNPNALHEAVERGVRKFLEHYQLRIVPVGFQWGYPGEVRCAFAMQPIPPEANVFLAAATPGK